jgi:hypothetical protein
MLGKLLRKVMRQPRGDNARKTKHRADASFSAELKRLGLNINRAIEAQQKSMSRAGTWFSSKGLRTNPILNRQTSLKDGAEGSTFFPRPGPLPRRLLKNETR